MLTALIISIAVVLIVLLLSLLTTSKAYSYKHTIDPLDEKPAANEEAEEKKETGPIP